jgi:outer membrane receptor protein involved in Fe transport
MKFNKAKSMLACAITLALSTHAAVAAEQAKEKKVERIVVSSQIIKLSPKSTADLFKAVPGVWVESSGGESGANVFVRGFPGGGDAPFLTLSIEGSPVYPAPTLSFLENSSLFRIDETIETMEALRGGPNPVLSNGQPGLTTNFRLKRGSEDTQGLFKYTTSDYDLQRVDAVLSGEITDDLYFMVGGYVKSSPGIRDAGFTSEKGSQFTINITKKLDNGELNFYTRQTDDHGAWYLPTPLNVDGIDAQYTQLGTLNRQATIFTGPNAQAHDIDLGDGRGWDGHVSGGSIKLEFDNGWQFIDRFNITKGDANTFGLVPNGSATTIGEVADNGQTAFGAVTNTEYASDTAIQQLGRWVVLKEISSFTNDLAFSKQFGDLSATLGYYTASTSASDWWSLGNTAYHVLEAGGELLNGIECNQSTAGCGFNYDISSTGDARTNAFYFTGQYKFADAFTLDLGVRKENHDVQYSVDEDLDGIITKTVDYDESKTSWTTGLNYSINDDMGVFARVNRGYKMPYFDDFRDNFGAYQGGEKLIKEVTQGELGYKLISDSTDFYATFFVNEVKGDTFVSRPGVPAEILTNEAYGVELDYNFNHESGFSVNLNTTLQQTEITESPENKGNNAQRQPKWQVRVTPSYDFEVDGMYATLYGTLSAVDDRFGNNENTVTLDGYEKVDLGLIIEPMEGIKLQLAIDNLTDEQGITEGDPRNADAPNGRYIMPRTTRLSVSYAF